MLCLGIESTAHTIGVGIVDEKHILSNVSEMYMPKKGGIHPREAANFHATRTVHLIRLALSNAGLRAHEIELVAFSQGPGLGPCLRTGATAARAFALSFRIPIIGVNHCIAHLEIGRFTTPAEDPILVYVSGGNTQIIAFSGGRYRVFGETLDIGIGNMLDKFGRAWALPFPSGRDIELLAKKGKHLVPLPYSVKGMDVAFSGILTAALNMRKKVSLEDMCFSIQETCFAMLTEVTERAMAHADKREILLGGGVAQNRRLQEMLNIMATDRGARLYVPPPALCADNGAMIAHTGLLMYSSGARMNIGESVVRQKFRTDDVDVIWRQKNASD